ncbi:MAG TPA: S53 family peptidase, partial [Xanthomonadaceae bacterium]|nr:S53 family peptidase [Xanthomonadaceae bacterium]
MTALSPARLRKASLALAVVAAIHGAGAVAAPAAATHVSVARTTSLERGDAIVGALPMAQPIRIQVALKMRNRDALDAFILQAAKKPIGSVASAMSQAQFLANHAPTQERAQAVADYLTGMGYRNVVIAPNRLLISADGTAATARNAFMTTFAQVRTHDARFAYANTDEVRIPAALKDDILAVLGLQNVHQAHTLAHGSPIGMGHAVPMAHRDGSHLGMARTGVEVTTNDVGLHWPTDFSSIYSYGSAAHAQGVVVGIVTSSGDLNNVISDLNRSHPEPEIPTQIVNTGTATDTTNDQFWDTDSQTLAGVGQVGRIYFYNTASLGSSDLVADFNTIVQGPVPIIDVQVGQCETYNLDDGSAAASDQIFALAAARGQTFSIANGIAGADECGDGGTTPIWPADSPYVVAVAGTALQTTGTSPNETWEAETVWAFGFNATGGSQSTFEPKPPWQTLWTGPRRGVADVAFDANLDSGEIIYVGGVEYEEGGTGLAAALFSSEWARLLQAKGYAYGFAGPVIYQLPQSDFHDITVGNNNGEVAGPGYDLASGRGSILLGNMLSNISDPVIANFSYVASGATVNFTDTSIDRSGGTLR